MRELFARTELLFGKEALDRLAASRVAVFGLAAAADAGQHAFVPTVAGFILAGEVVKDRIGYLKRGKGKHETGNEHPPRENGRL